jgi:hypothetical protein
MARIVSGSGTLAAVAGLLVSAGLARAQIVLVTSRAALGADDYIDWGVLGVDGNSPVSNPVTVQSTGGIATVVGKPAGTFLFLQQAKPTDRSPPYWGGNFTPTDNLLNTSSNDPGPLTLSFKQTVLGAGAQIEADGSGAFTARLTAYDGRGLQLASVTENGVATGAKDGTAIFLGLLDTATEIKSVQFSIDDYPPPGSGTGFTDFTINRLSITSSAAVPEPSSSALLGIAAIGGVRYMRRRLRMRADLAGGRDWSPAAVGISE